jgi:hypothetical protein
VRIGGVDRRQHETVCAGQRPSRVIGRQRNSPDVRLGVKWSQAQILSARHRMSRSNELDVRAGTGRAIRQAAFGFGGRSPRNFALVQWQPSS